MSTRRNKGQQDPVGLGLKKSKVRRLKLVEFMEGLGLEALALDATRDFGRQTELL